MVVRDATVSITFLKKVERHWFFVMINGRLDKSSE